MSGSTPPRKNPFVGPRSFQEGEPLHGRSRETIELANLLIAERIVLFYSPSGAGKTSLIHAALLPKLKARRFTPLPVMRLNLEPPPGLSGLAGFNRYTFSALSSLEKNLPESAQLPDDELSKLSLAEYLSRRFPEESAQEKAKILVFDQFEEILTVDSSDLTHKQAFFAQLGASLEDPNRWALFSMREDYIAGLDPYTLAVPTHFRNTFRLDLLSPATARQVLQQTTLQENVTFAEEAADKLIADLSRVRVQKLDGSIEDKAGVSVEPVQMQVVCFNLWEKLDPGVDVITLDEIEAIGDVDQALGDYYSTQVGAVANRQEIPERTLRRWFDQVLITPSGIRNQVLLEKDASQGLENDTIYRLEDAHLVRLESGRNRTWVELAHDRLVAPVRRSNSDWFEENLSLLQRQAGHWHVENRPEHLLLRGEALLEAQNWAGQHAKDMLAEEVEFLDASQEAEAKEKAARQLAEAERRSQTQRRFLLLITLALLAAVVFAINSFFQSRAARTAEAVANTQRSVAEVARSTSEAASTEIANQAENERDLRLLAQQQEATAKAASTLAVANAEQARENAERADENAELAHAAAELAFSRQLAAQGSSLLATQPNLAALLAVESYALVPAWENKTLLLEIVQRQESQTIIPFGPPLPEETGALNTISAFAISPDGERLAWGTLAGDVTVWNYQTHNYEPGWDSVRLHSGNVLSLEFSPDGTLLASGGIRQQQLFVTNLNTNERITLDANNQIRALAFHPSESLLAVAVLNRIRLWDTTTWEEIETGFVGESDRINDLAWSPDGKMLAYSLTAVGARTNQGVGIWSLETYGVLSRFNRDTESHQVSWSPDGSLLAAASQDGSVRFWEIPGFVPSTRAEVPQLEQAVYAAAFSPDGKTFVRGGADVGFTVFSTQNFTEIARINSPINGWIRSLNYFPETGFNLLAAVSENQANSRSAVNLYVVNSSQPLGLERLTGSGGIQSLASPGVVDTLDLSPDGKRIVSGDTAGVARVWELSTGQIVARMDHEDSVTSVAFSPDGESVVTGSLNVAILWDVNTSTEIHRMVHENWVTSIVFSPDGERGLTASQDGTIKTWEAATGAEITRVEQRYGVTSLTISPDGKRVASGDLGGYVQVWDAENSMVLSYYQLHTRGITSLAISPDGKWIVTGSLDASAEIWDAATGQLVARLPHNNEVLSVAFNIDGSMLATGSGVGTLILWDLASFQPIGNPMNPGLTSRERGLTSIFFSPDNHLLYAGYADGSLWEWNVSTEAWVDIVCEEAGRSLSDTEQAQYFRDGGYQDICASR